MTQLPRGGKRLGMEKDGFLGDWFVSYSPRNSNSNAEGSWDHWVQLAVGILQHPATHIVRPEAHAAVKDLVNTDFYSESARDLTDAELESVFGATS